MIKKFLAMMLMVSVFYLSVFWIAPQFTDGPVLKPAPLTQADINLINEVLSQNINLMKERNGGITWDPYIQ